MGVKVRRSFLLVFFCLALSACGDPLAKVPKLSDVDLSDETPVVEALPVALETDENAGFFKRLMRKRNLEDTAISAPVPVQSTANIENADLLIVPKVNDIIAKDPALDDVKTIKRNGVDKEKSGGFWSFGRKASVKSALENPTVETQMVEKPQETSQPNKTPIPADAKAEQEGSDDLDAPIKRAGLFGFAKPSPKIQTQKQNRTASLGPVEKSPTADSGETPSKNKQGLFGPRRKASKLTGPDAREVSFGTTLPFGEVARVCGASKRALGKEVAKFPERRTKYRLYDGAVGNIRPHNFYVTGFPDGCARQFTAALVMFGSPVMHEQLRYGRPAATQPYSATDKAYEKVKSRVCRVGRKKPCGDKIRLLEKDTVFISVYNSFGGNSNWSNLLLHKGKLLANARVGGG